MELKKILNYFPSNIRLEKSLSPSLPRLLRSQKGRGDVVEELSPLIEAYVHILKGRRISVFEDEEAGRLFSLMASECDLTKTLDYIKTIDIQDIRSDIILLLLEAINKYEDKGVRFPVYISKQLRYYISKKFGRMKISPTPDPANLQESYQGFPDIRIAIKEINNSFTFCFLNAVGLSILEIRELAGINTNTLMTLLKETKEELLHV